MYFFSLSFPRHRIADVLVAAVLDVGEADYGDEVSNVDEQEEGVDPPGGEPLELQVGLDKWVGQKALLLGLESESKFEQTNMS